MKTAVKTADRRTFRRPGPWRLGRSYSKETGSISAQSSIPYGVVSSSARRRSELYEEALRAYQQAHFSTCQHIVEALLREEPENTAAHLLLQRCTTFLSEQPLTADQLDSWTGVRVMTDK